MAERTFNLADLYEVLADTCPERLALVAGEVRLTYRELDERGTRVAHAFLAAGLEPGDHVGVYARNRAEWLESMLGAFKARVVPININFRYVEDELRYIVDNADLKALVVERSYLPKVAAVRADAPLLATVFWLDDESGVPVDLGDARPALLCGHGRRGVPGAGLRAAFRRRPVHGLHGRHHGLPEGRRVAGRGHLLRCAQLRQRPAGRARGHRGARRRPPLVQMLTTPLMHGNGQWVTWITLFRAGTAVMWTGHRYDPAEILRSVEREGATTMMLVGDAMARPIADEIARGGYDVSALKVVGSGGALLSPAVKDQLRELVPGLFISDGFGASEFGAGSAQDAEGRFPLKPQTAVLGDDLKPVVPGRPGGWPVPGISRSVTTRTRSRRPPFPVDADGVRWWCRATTPGWRTTAR
ncbi:AMP-binding protein [Yinghuangia aomiensis]